MYNMYSVKFIKWITKTDTKWMENVSSYLTDIP